MSFHGAFCRRTSALVPAAMLALSAGVTAARDEPPCWPAIDTAATNLPELVQQDGHHTWRGLPVEFECRGREIGSVTVRWSVKAAGSLADARSAVSALGSRLTADTATAVRAALDRCIAGAGKGNGTSRASSSRSVVGCVFGPEAATFTVQRREADE